VPPLISTDVKLYEENLFNLITNAVKFNKKGGMIKITQDYDRRS